MSEEQQTATLDEAVESKMENIDGRGGKQERCGYLFAAAGRGPDSVNPSFYVVAILSLAFLDSRCYDPNNTEFDGMKCTQYSYIEFTYARSALEAVNWRREHDIDNITEGQQGLLQYDCGESADPCVQYLEESEIDYSGFDAKLHNLPNDWYPNFHRSMVEGVDFIQNISQKIPAELLPDKATCDCRGGHARLGSSSGIAPSSVISYSMPIICVLEAISLPFIGALTDYTPHRKTVWLVNFGLLVTTTVLTGVLWHNYIWVAAVTFTILTSIFFDAHLFSIQAYLPEFGNSKEILKLSSFSQAIHSTSQVAFVTVGIAFSAVMPTMLGPLYGTIVTAMIMTVLNGLWALAFTIPAAFKMQKRSATPMPEEWQQKSVFAVGFLRVGRTACEALKLYPEVVKYWAYNSIMYTWAVSTIFLSTSYFDQQLRMNQLETVLVALCVLASVVPGALMVACLSRCVTRKWILLATTVGALVLSVFPSTMFWEPRMKVVAYPFGVLIGFLFGLYFALTSGVYASIIPGGQEAEYTAVGMWFTTLCRWLPGVIYGVMVDLSPTQNHRWAFLHMSVYPVISIILLLLIDFKKAERDITESLKRRKTDNKSIHIVHTVAVVPENDE